MSGAYSGVMAAPKTEFSGPRLRSDLHGYYLDGESVDGFPDRPELPLSDRIVIARLGRRYSPTALSDAQRKLLRTPTAKRRPIASELLRGFAINETAMDAAAEEGYLEELSERDLHLVADPSLHPDLPRVAYPLAIGELAILAGASTRQLRHWEDAGLVPAVRVNGQRRFYSASVARALVLARAETYQVSALASIARGERDGLRLLRLVAATAASFARDRLSSRQSAPFVDAAHKLSGLTTLLSLAPRPQRATTARTKRKAPVLTARGSASVVRRSKAVGSTTQRPKARSA